MIAVLSGLQVPALGFIEDTFAYPIPNGVVNPKPTVIVSPSCAYEDDVDDAGNPPIP